MRQLIFFILLVATTAFPSAGIMAQDPATDVVKKNIVDILISAHVLLSDTQRSCTSGCFRIGCPWDNNAGKRKRYLDYNTRLQYDLLKNFIPPAFCKDEIISKNWIFNTKSLTSLGSYIIRNNNYDNIRLSPTPELPILSTDNQLQMNIPNPADYSSHYLVNYNADKSFTSAVNVDLGGGFGDYFNSKNNEKNNISSELKRQISLGTGTFINALGLIFEDINNGQATASEFNMLYNLWQKNADGTIKSGDSIIYSFDGMCIYSTTESKYNSSNEVTSSMTSNIASPFVTASLKGNAQWDYSKNITTTLKTYDIYMFRQPKLIKVPLPTDISRNWKKLSNYSTNPIDLSKGDLLPSSKPLIIPVKFGPLPDIADVLHSVRLDTAYIFKNISIKVDNQLAPDAKLDAHDFIRQMVLVTDDQSRIKPSSQNDKCYWFDLEIYRNDNSLNTFAAPGQQVNFTIPLKIDYDLPIPGDAGNAPQYLTKIYDNFAIRTQLTPTPYVTTYNITPTKDARNNNYVYSLTFYFDKPQTLTISSIPRLPSVSEVYGLPTGVDQSLSSSIRNTQQVRSVNDAQGNPGYQLTFNIPLQNNYFNANFPLYNIGLGISFNATNLADNNSNSPYKRILLIGLNQPEEPAARNDSTKSAVVFKNNLDLVNSLNAAALLQNGQTVAQLLIANTKDAKLNILSFIDDFKKLSNTDVSNNEYVVDSKFVKKNL